ncbi:hypothetical protein, partial [Mycobacteroides abscessus]|uniref:hypothetical protein n=1 Tax=Mycobacteroides abscessus TaxID=36809 RepID=UPI001A9766AE
SSASPPAHTQPTRHPNHRPTAADRSTPSIMKSHYTVTPLYKGSELMPAAVQIIAKGEDGFNLAVTILNR